MNTYLVSLKNELLNSLRKLKDELDRTDQPERSTEVRDFVSWLKENVKED